MKILLNWLKEFIDLDWEAHTLAEKLTFAGLEVESIQPVGRIPETVFVVQIEKIEKHPQADKLSLCRVSLGGEIRTIVCGAKNMKEGDLVPLAVPGTILPDGKRIDEGKIRGIASAGMLCSEKELGLASESEGLLILPPDLEVGKPLCQLLPLADTLLEINVTPNRSDALSILGIAREVAALTGKKIKAKSPMLPRPAFSLNSLLTVKIAPDAKELAPRYTARMMRNVKVKPSPYLIRKRLEWMGIRSINNIVDATNYVMLELGQPLHAFDYPSVAGGEIQIRRARPKEKIATLDGVERELIESDLLIADPQKPLAVAGVMGGARSGVEEKTTDLVLEGAFFDPASIRKTSRRLGLQSESSYRFERGVDPNGLLLASDRLAQLILEWGGGEISSEILDTSPSGFPNNSIWLRPQRLAQILGVQWEDQAVATVLHHLGFHPQQEPDGWRCSIPTYRPDLAREIDLIEEVARIIGYSQVPTTLPDGALRPVQDQEKGEREWLAREYLRHLGFSEVIHYSFCSEKEILQTLLPLDKCIKLSNPISDELALMRPSLIPTLLTTIRKNEAQQNKNLRLFELRNTYAQDGKERQKLAIALTGLRHPRHWDYSREKADFFDLKGIVEGLFLNFGISSFELEASSQSYLHPGISAQIRLDQAKLADFGQIHPQVALNFEMTEAVFVAEIDFQFLKDFIPRPKSHSSLPKFPFIERDITLVVEKDLPALCLLEKIKKMNLENLFEAQLVDVYTGKPIEEGRKALTYSIRYQSPTSTLTDEEVNHTHQQLTQRLRS